MLDKMLDGKCKRKIFSSNISSNMIQQCWMKCRILFLGINVHCKILKLITKSGAQPEIFQGRGGFVELGHFDKLFVKNTKRKVSLRKLLELFLLDTLKTTF